VACIDRSVRRIAAALLFTGVAGTAWAGEILASVRDQKGRPLEDAVVLALPLDRKAFEVAKPARFVVDQVNKEFVPYVRVIFAGTSVSFPNKDNIRHHVYSFSPAKKFELPLYSGVSAPAVLFDKTGVVVLGCNIHDWMIGYIYVADTPFFAKTDKGGQAALANLPAGEYQLRVWHPDMEQGEPATLQRLTLDKSTNVAWTLALKPSFRIPRPAGGSNSSYR
jgi:plastocyanin